MQIVIDIPKEIYIHLLARYKYQNTDDIGLSELDKVGVSIKNGTPLPENHGRLIDETQIHKCGWDYIKHHAKTDAPTIIEADKEGKS